MAKKVVQMEQVAPGKVPITIRAPNFQIATFLLIGTSPYVQHRFSAKAMEQMIAKQESGQRAKKGTTREAKDFNQVYKDAMYISTQGWHGVPASSFRNAMISACRTVNYKMTHAKLAIFVVADGIDATDATQLVRIEGKPRKYIGPARNQTGVIDIRVRPMWEKRSITLRVRFDADMFSLLDVTNLLARAGMQVGIGEGRPDSRESAGLGWGTFELSK